MDLPETTCISGFVQAPIDKVWAVFRNFDPSNWWKIYTRMEVKENIRYFVVRGVEMAEELDFQSDEHYEQRYKLISPSPSVGIDKALTTVKMYPVGTNTTLISWCAQYKPLHPQYTDAIHAAQTQAFEGAIHSLSQQFDSSLTLQDFILPLKHNFLGLIRDLIQATQQDPTARWEYTSMGEKFKEFPKQLKGLNFHCALQPEKNALLIQRVNEFGVDLLLSYPKQGSGNHVSGWTVYDSYYRKFLTRPDCAKHWKDDAEFCKQFLQGANPMLIRVVDSIDKLPKEFHDMKHQHKSIQDLIQAKELFCADYELLLGLEPSQGKVIYAPFVVFHKENGSALKVVGIMLRKENNTVYTPASPPNKYLYAKILVACADSQVHEFLFHLGYTHLAMEPLAIATHNVLERAHHPLGYLLAPHFKDTIGINYVARQTLVSHQGAFTDKTFSLGFNGGIDLIRKGFQNYSLKKISFPNQLKERGFDEKKTDGLEGFYFRDYGFKIWNAIQSYVTEVVDRTFQQTSFENDKVVQEWIQECSDESKAAVPGFEVKSKSELIETLTTIIFNCSAQHSAINFSQYEYGAYIPNRPICTTQKMPDGSDDITMDFILSALPKDIVAHFQMLFAYLLTTWSNNPLDGFELKDGCPDFMVAAHNRFRKLLKTIEKGMNIKEYEYLLPSRISASIDI